MCVSICVCACACVDIPSSDLTHCPPQIDAFKLIVEEEGSEEEEEHKDGSSSSRVLNPMAPTQRASSGHSEAARCSSKQGQPLPASPPAHFARMCLHDEQQVEDARCAEVPAPQLKGSRTGAGTASSDHRGSSRVSQTQPQPLQQQQAGHAGAPQPHPSTPTTVLHPATNLLCHEEKGASELPAASATEQPLPTQARPGQEPQPQVQGAESHGSCSTLPPPPPLPQQQQKPQQVGAGAGRRSSVMLPPTQQVGAGAGRRGSVVLPPAQQVGAGAGRRSSVMLPPAQQVGAGGRRSSIMPPQPPQQAKQAAHVGWEDSEGQQADPQPPIPTSRHSSGPNLVASTISVCAPPPHGLGPPPPALSPLLLPRAGTQVPQGAEGLVTWDEAAEGGEGGGAQGLAPLLEGAGEQEGPSAGAAKGLLGCGSNSSPPTPEDSYGDSCGSHEADSPAHGGPRQAGRVLIELQPSVPAATAATSLPAPGPLLTPLQELLQICGQDVSGQRKAGGGSWACLGRAAVVEGGVHCPCGVGRGALSVWCREGCIVRVV